MSKVREHMTLSEQFIGSVMMAFQKCMLEGLDISDILETFDVLVDGDDELFVTNTPSYTIDIEKIREIHGDEMADEMAKQVATVESEEG